jgi:hypothetical protein
MLSQEFERESFWFRSAFLVAKVYHDKFGLPELGKF